MFKYELQIEHERSYTSSYLSAAFTINLAKWSCWLKESISIGLFKNILGINPKVDLSRSSVVFAFVLA